MVSLDGRRTKVHEIRGVSVDRPLGQSPNRAKFHRTRSNDVREKRYIFTPFSTLAPQGGPPVPSSPIWVMMYSKAPSIKLLNVVHFIDDVAEWLGLHTHKTNKQ